MIFWRLFFAVLFGSQLTLLAGKVSGFVTLSWLGTLAPVLLLLSIGAAAFAACLALAVVILILAALFGPKVPRGDA